MICLAGLFPSLHTVIPAKAGIHTPAFPQFGVNRGFNAETQRRRGTTRLRPPGGQSDVCPYGPLEIWRLYSRSAFLCASASLR